MVTRKSSQTCHQTLQPQRLQVWCWTETRRKVPVCRWQIGSPRILGEPLWQTFQVRKRYFPPNLLGSAFRPTTKRQTKPTTELRTRWSLVWKHQSSWMDQICSINRIVHWCLHCLVRSLQFGIQDQLGHWCRWWTLVPTVSFGQSNYRWYFETLYSRRYGCHRIHCLWSFELY